MDIDDAPLDFELEDQVQVASSPVLAKKRRKVIISLDDLVKGHHEDERKEKEKRSKQAKRKKIYNTDDDDDDDDDAHQTTEEAQLSITVDGCQQKIEEICGEDEYSAWGLPIFQNQKTPPPLVFTELGSCTLLQVFMKNELNSIVDVTVEKGETFLRGLLVNGWLLKMVVMSGHLEKPIAAWTFNSMLYSSEEELRMLACDFWCSVLSSEKKIRFDWLPSYSELKRALQVYGSVLDSSTFFSTNTNLVQSGSSNLSLDSDCGWMPQNIRAWIKFIGTCCQVRRIHSIFSTSEAEELLEALICFFLDRRLQGLTMLMYECVQSAISFFTDEEWHRSSDKVAKAIACRVPRDLNCLRIVECISGISIRSKLIKSALSYEILILCLDNKVIDGKEILKHLSSIKLKDKSCDLFKMYICLALTENWLLAAPLLESQPEIYKDWNTYLRNCCCQINTMDMRSYASKVRTKASYLLQGTVRI